VVKQLPQNIGPQVLFPFFLIDLNLQKETLRIRVIQRQGHAALFWVPWNLPVRNNEPMAKTLCSGRPL
jgi:hypothetical protein